MGPGRIDLAKRRQVVLMDGKPWVHGQKGLDLVHSYTKNKYITNIIYNNLGDALIVLLYLITGCEYGEAHENTSWWVQT